MVQLPVGPATKVAVAPETVRGLNTDSLPPTFFIYVRRARTTTKRSNNALVYIFGLSNNAASLHNIQSVTFDRFLFNRK
jgi:hypothetical protein